MQNLKNLIWPPLTQAINRDYLWISSSPEELILNLAELSLLSKMTVDIKGIIETANMKLDSP